MERYKEYVMNRPALDRRPEDEEADDADADEADDADADEADDSITDSSTESSDEDLEENRSSVKLDHSSYCKVR